MANEIFAFIMAHPYLSFFVFITSLSTLVLLLFSFDITFKKGIPTFKRRSEKDLQGKVAELNATIAKLSEEIEFAHKADFFKKTENGEYIGYSVAKKPYVEIWCEGNWNGTEHHDEFVRLGLLWTDETSVIIHGQSPNLPSQLWSIIETKAKNLDKKMEESPGCNPELFTLTINCHKDVEEVFKRFFKDFTNVRIEAR